MNAYLYNPQTQPKVSKLNFLLNLRMLLFSFSVNNFVHNIELLKIIIQCKYYWNDDTVMHAFHANFTSNDILFYDWRVAKIGNMKKCLTCTRIEKHQEFYAHQMLLPLLKLSKHQGHAQPLCIHHTFLENHLCRPQHILQEVFWNYY